MSIFDSFILACSTNIDNLAVGLAFGSRTDVRFGHDANAIVASLSFLSTFASIWLGHELLRLLPSPLLVRRLAGIALLLVALCLLFTSLLQARRQNDEKDDRDNGAIAVKQGRVSARDALGIGLALTLTNVGTGIVGGLHALNPFVAGTMSSITSFGAIAIGLWAGRAAAMLTASVWPSVMSSLLLAVFALRVLIEE